MAVEINGFLPRENFFHSKNSRKMFLLYKYKKMIEIKTLS